MGIFTVKKGKTVDEVLCDNCLCKNECAGSCPVYVFLGENTVFSGTKAA